MFARFTAEARQACSVAGLEAISLGASFIGTEHLLLGVLVAQPGCIEELHQLGLGAKEVRKALQADASTPRPRPLLHYSEHAVVAIRAADSYSSGSLVDTRHMWQGLLSQPDSGAVKILLQLGFDLQTAASASSSPSTSTEIARRPDKKKAGLLRDLCSDAAAGLLAPAVGRKEETQQVMETLLRWHKSTPVLVGDPGVGKTAVVEGLAALLAEGKVPRPLKDHRIMSLDVGGLVAGTRYRGDLEERVQGLLLDLRSDSKQILFIDELHTVLGAGGSEGSLDLGGLLKPMLARGEIKMIAATTNRDYQRYLAQDPAFERRLQPIQIDEPSESEALEMLAGVKDRLQKHHHLVIEDKAVQGALRMSVRYLPSRKLPDKAIDVLDQAAAAAALSGRSRLTEALVASTMSAWTGVTVGDLRQDEIKNLGTLKDRLAEGVIDQPDATDAVARSLLRARVGLAPRRRPLGSFIFCGPTGVGKTETARVLAEQLFGDRDLVTRFDMSEYSEPHSASRLIGSSPGYVGYEDGGQLVNAVRKKPHAVLLLDEIEKAHSSISHLLLQIMEEGELSDGRGNTADFRNVVIIMTSNLGAKWSTHSKPAMGFADQDPLQARQTRMADELKNFFAPEMLGRVDEIVHFQPLSDSAMVKISQHLMTDLSARLSDMQLRLFFSAGVAAWLAGKNQDHHLGARPLRGLLRNEIEDPLTELIVNGDLLAGGSVHLGVRAGRLTMRCA
jgi:ATP-dependent Clp protease ATP-binding subunit ClpC